MTAASSLRELLRGAFSVEELRRLLLDLPSCDSEIQAQFPGDEASLDRWIDAALPVLERRGLLDAAFFAHVAAARPWRVDELVAIAAERGVYLPDAVEVASLLSERRDAAVERKLAELERSLATTSADRLEFNLAIADLNRWHQEAIRAPRTSEMRREAIVRRLTALAAALGGRGPRAPNTAVRPHPEAVALRDEIESHVRRADGERAVLRLLDLAPRFASDRAMNRSAMMLSAQIRTWRAAYRRGALDPGERHEWVGLLQRILELTDEIVEASATAARPRGEIRTAAARDAHECGALVTCEALAKRYAKQGLFALRDVSLTIRPRMVVGVVGPNGAGKTTLLRILAGELSADGGVLRYPQFDQPKVDAKAIDWPTVRAQIAFLPQRLPMWHGRLADNLHLWATACGIVDSENADTVEFYLERLGLTRYRDATWGEISGGFQTRFALARALVGQPRLLILDEPLAALDVRAQQRFLQDIRDIVSSGTLQQSVVLSSQHIPEVESIADEVVSLRDDGAVSFHGSMHELERVRTDSLYELGGQLSDECRDRLVARFGPGCLQRRESIALLRIGRDVPRAEVLALLHADDTPPTYVRDISASLTRMFWSGDP